MRVLGSLFARICLAGAHCRPCPRADGDSAHGRARHRAAGSRPWTRSPSRSLTRCASGSPRPRAISCCRARSWSRSSWSSPAPTPRRPACRKRARASAPARSIFGNVKRAGNDYQVTLKLLDVSRAVVESFAAETVVQEELRRQRPAFDGARLAGQAERQGRRLHPGARQLPRRGREPGRHTGGNHGRRPGRHQRRRPGPSRGRGREERLHHDQAGVHAGRGAEPAAEPRAEPGLGRGAPP